MAIGTSGTLTQEFVDQLSQELLVEPDAQYVFAALAGAARAGALGLPEIMGRSGDAANTQQAMGGGMGTLRLLDEQWMSVAREFAKVVMEPATPGKVIKIDQPRYLGGTFTESSRVLTEGTPVTATTQAPTMGQVTVTVKQYGGPHDGSNVAPVGITDFLRNRAKHDLIEYIGTILRRDRNKFVDRVIVDLLLTTTKITTVDGTAEGSMTAGQGLEEDTLAAAYRAMSERNIPTFPNGMYMLVITPKQFENLKLNAAFRESVRYLGEKGALISGHLSNHGGFMICQSNTIPTKAVGAGGAVTAQQALAFGPSAIGWGIGLDAEARRSKDDDFGREDKFLWIAHEGWALLDEDFVQTLIST